MKIGIGAKWWEYGNIFSLPIIHSKYLINTLELQKWYVNDETEKYCKDFCWSIY